MLDRYPPLLPQRQDSLKEQLQDLHIIAACYGMYDAADWLWKAMNARERARAPRNPPEVGTVTSWNSPATLRGRDEAGLIECQDVMSGRWYPVSDPRWDDCVIAVPYRVKPDGLGPHPTDDLLRRARQQAQTGNYWAGKCVGLIERLRALEELINPVIDPPD